jgi:hypothetical protein
VNTFTQVESVGYVGEVEWRYSVSEGATCTIKVGFVRPVSSLQTHGADKHFYYDTDTPFLNASWIAESDFKTF